MMEHPSLVQAEEDFQRDLVLRGRPGADGLPDAPAQLRGLAVRQQGQTRLVQAGHRRGSDGTSW